MDALVDQAIDASLTGGLRGRIRRCSPGATASSVRSRSSAETCFPKRQAPEPTASAVLLSAESAPRPRHWKVDVILETSLSGNDERRSRAALVRCRWTGWRSRLSVTGPAALTLLGCSSWSGSLGRWLCRSRGLGPTLRRPGAGDGRSTARHPMSIVAATRYRSPPPRCAAPTASCGEQARPRSRASTSCRRTSQRWPPWHRMG